MREELEHSHHQVKAKPNFSNENGSVFDVWNPLTVLWVPNGLIINTTSPTSLSVVHVYSAGSDRLYSTAVLSSSPAVLASPICWGLHSCTFTNGLLMSVQGV